jgi:PilZ domain
MPGPVRKNIPSLMTCTEEHEALINRRRYPRYEIDTELHVTMLGLEHRGTMRGRALNISEAGIAGVFVTVWDVGTLVHLEFSVPVTSSPLRVGGVLRSHSGYRYGFEFADLGPDQCEIIGKTCRTLALLE